MPFLVNTFGITDLRYYNSCQLLSDFPSKFQSIMTIFHHINVNMKYIPKMDELKVSSVDSIRELIHKKVSLENFTTVTRNAIQH